MKTSITIEDVKAFLENYQKPTVSTIPVETLKTLFAEQVEDKPMTSKQAHNYLGVSLQTLYHYCHQKRIPFYKPNGRKNYFLKRDLDAFLLGKRSQIGRAHV